MTAAVRPWTLAELMALEDEWRPAARPDLAPPPGAFGAEPWPLGMFAPLLDAALGWHRDTTGTSAPTFADLGAGTGAKVLYAAARGCAAWGVELVPELAEAARQAGADVRTGRAEDAGLAGVHICWCAGLYRDPAAQAALERDLAGRLDPGAVLALGMCAASPPQGWTELASGVFAGQLHGAWARP